MGIFSTNFISSQHEQRKSTYAEPRTYEQL